MEPRARREGLSARAYATPNTSQFIRRQQSVSVVTAGQTTTKSRPGSEVVITQQVTSTAPAPSPTPMPPAEEQKHTPAGPVAGGVVGGVVGLLLLVLLAYLLLRRMRNQRATRALDSAYAEAGIGGGGVDRRTRMRPAQAIDEPWSPGGMAMHASNSGQPSLGGAGSDPYFASPVHHHYDDMEMGVRPSMQKTPRDSTQHDPVAWPDFQPGPAARQMSQFQDEAPLADVSTHTNLAAPTVHVSHYENMDAEEPVPTTQVPVASSDAYASAAPTEMLGEIDTTSGAQQHAADADTFATAPPSSAAPAISTQTLANAPARESLPRLNTDSLSRKDSNAADLQSPSSAYMWLPPRKLFTESTEEEAPEPGAAAAPARPSLLRSESNMQDSAEEQELSNKLWRNNGTLRVANES